MGIELNDLEIGCMWISDCHLGCSGFGVGVGALRLGYPQMLGTCLPQVLRSCWAAVEEFDCFHCWDKDNSARIDFPKEVRHQNLVELPKSSEFQVKINCYARNVYNSKTKLNWSVFQLRMLCISVHLWEQSVAHSQWRTSECLSKVSRG